MNGSNVGWKTYWMGGWDCPTKERGEEGRKEEKGICLMVHLSQDAYILHLLFIQPSPKTNLFSFRSFFLPKAAESTNSRIKYWSVFQALALFGVCAWQVYYLKVITLRNRFPHFLLEFGLILFFLGGQAFFEVKRVIWGKKKQGGLFGF